MFNNLPKEKKERIIEEAMSVFAAHGYHKTSAADIAKAAGISKAMVFTYFGSKYGCYEYMCNEMLRISYEKISPFKEQLIAITDYFERVILTAKIKIDVLKKCKPLLLFATSVFEERDDEVRSLISEIIAKAYRLRETVILTGIDSSKFKDPDDAVRIEKMAIWMSKGCSDEWSRSKSESLDSILAEFIDCMMTLKKHFYREEYL